MKKRIIALLLALLLAAPALAELSEPCREGQIACMMLRLAYQGAFEAFEEDDPLAGRVLASAWPLLADVAEEDLEHFCRECGVDRADAEEAWFEALRASLLACILAGGQQGRMSDADRVLLLFLDPDDEDDAQAQMEQIRGRMTEETLQRIAQERGAPPAFLRWLMAAEEEYDR